MREKFYYLLAFLFISLGAMAQQRKISGKVFDEQGEPLVGVSVSIDGTTQGSLTNQNGRFEVEVQTTNAKLKFSYTGYETQMVSVQEKSELEIQMFLASQLLEEAIVVAYGTTNKQTFTGSATKIGGKEIDNQQVGNISRALEGVAAGVQVSSNSGQPGANWNIRIRGVNSLNASEDPLYVVDGVPFQGDINAINQNDIESISVLKDAASAALYGSRASNGVIVVKTKSGRRGKPRYSFSARVGANGRGVPEYDKIKDPGEYYQLAWTALRNEAMTRTSKPLSEADAGKYASTNLIEKLGYNNYNVPNNELIDPVTGKLNPNARLRYHDDWAKEAFEPQIRQEYFGSVSGLSNKTNYYISLGYLQDKGYVIKSDFQRFNSKVNLTQELTKWLEMGVNLTYASSVQNNTQGGGAYQNFFVFTRGIAPIFPVYQYDADGKVLRNAKGEKVFDYGTNPDFGLRTYAGTENPISTLNLDVIDIKADNLIGRTFMNFKLRKDLKFNVSYSKDFVSGAYTTWQNNQFGNAAGVNGRGTRGMFRRITQNFNQIVSYTPSFDDNNFDLTLGHENYHLFSDVIEGRKENFLLTDNPQLSNAATFQSLGSQVDNHKIEGYFARLEYNFKKKYLVSGSIRRDGTSRFAENHRWGTFWSIGLGYNLAEEDFMQQISWVDFLKLRASVGTRGNEGLIYTNGLPNFYAYKDQYEVSSSNNEIALNQTYKGNKDLTWETKSDIDLGLDFRVFDRLEGTFDYFNNKIKDLLFNRPLPLSTGFISFPDNIGDMVTKGFEFALDYHIKKSTNWDINVGINGIGYKNEITFLPDEFKEDGIVTGNFKLLEGHSKYDYFIRQHAGIDKTTGVSQFYKDILDADSNPTGEREKVNTNSAGSRNYTGQTAIADFAGGLNTDVRFKNFRFYSIFSYQVGGSVYDAGYASLMGSGGGDWNNWHPDIYKSWSFSNTNANIPILKDNYPDANAVSDRFLTDASYFNIRNLTLEYIVPAGLLDRVHKQGAKVSIIADNVYLFSKRKGLDPRQSFNGSISNVYSPIRTISIGLNFNL